MTAYITYAHAESPSGPRFLDIAGNAPPWAHDVRDATPEEISGASASPPCLAGGARPDPARLLSQYKRLDTSALAVLDCVETHPGVCMITRINTPAKFRGQGIASDLLKRTLARADRLGVVMTLSIHPSDGLDYDALDAWYRRHGFEPRSCGDGVYERDFRGSKFTSGDAAVVLAAMDSGDWRVWRAPWQDYMTTTGNRRGAWVAERVRAPFCAVRGGGQYGPRHWEGATAIEALKAGCDDLGIDIGEYEVGL